MKKAPCDRIKSQAVCGHRTFYGAIEATSYTYKDQFTMGRPYPRFDGPLCQWSYAPASFICHHDMGSSWKVHLGQHEVSPISPPPGPKGTRPGRLVLPVLISYLLHHFPKRPKKKTSKFPTQPSCNGDMNGSKSERPAGTPPHFLYGSLEMWGNNKLQVCQHHRMPRISSRE